MIVAVCSDKGAPGVTTLAMALALAWEGPRLLLEADPSGGDLTFRARTPDGAYLDRAPTVLELALAARARDVPDLTEYAQPTTLGVDMIPGPPVAEGWIPVRGLWEQVAEQITAWPGTVIVDLGRLHPGHPATALVQAADMVLLLAHPTVEGTFHMRARAGELARWLDIPRAHRPLGGVVLRVGRKDKEAARQANQIMQSGTAFVPLVGAIADDPAGVKLLLAGADSTHLRRTALMRSVADLIARGQRWTWPPAAERPAAARPAGRQPGNPRAEDGFP